MSRRLVIDALAFADGRAYGFQEYLFNLLDYFYEHREALSYSEIIVVVNESERSHFEKFEDRFQLKAYGYRHIVRRMWLQQRMTRDLRLTEVDTVLYPANYSAAYSAANSVLVVHDLLFKRKDYLPKRAMRWQREVFVPLSLRQAKKVITISHFNKRDIESYYGTPANKIEVVYNYFNFSKFEHDAEPPIDVGPDYFLSVASAAKHKNSVTTLRAFIRYAEQGGESRLVMVGRFPSGEFEAVYSGMPDELKSRVSSLQHVSNGQLAHLYRHCRALVSSTLFEGLGMPIVEAMYFGRPVVVSDIDVLREVTANQAYYFDPLDPEALAGQLLAVEGASEVPEYELERFSAANTAMRYVEILNAV